LLASLAQKGAVHSATFSPSGKMIATTSGKTTKVWQNYFLVDYLESKDIPKLTMVDQLQTEVITLDEIKAQIGQLSHYELPPKDFFGKMDDFYQTNVNNAKLVENKKRYLQQLAVLFPFSSQKIGDMKSQIIEFENVASGDTSQIEPDSESQQSTLNMEIFFLVMFLGLLIVMVIGQLKVFFHRGRDLRGVVYGIITVVVLGNWLVCYDNFYLHTPMLDQAAIDLIGKGLPSLGLILFSVMMLIVAAFFLFYARKRFFQRQVLSTLLLGFSLMMLVLPIEYLVVNYDILQISRLLQQFIGSSDPHHLNLIIAYGFILGSVMIVFLPIPLTAYTLRPNRQNWWRWPAIVLKTISMALAYVLLLLVTGLLFALLDDGLAFNAIPSVIRLLLLLVAGILLGQVIYAQFRVYRQQRKWFSLASFTLVYGLILFGFVWVLLGKGVLIDMSFFTNNSFDSFDGFRRVVLYYEIADVLTLLGSLIAVGFAIVKGRKTYQTQHYNLSGVYWLASLFLVISIAIYVWPYGSLLSSLTLVLGSLLLLSYGIGNWLDNRRSWIARGIFVAVLLVILAAIAWFVLINRADKTKTPMKTKTDPEVQLQPDERSEDVLSQDDLNLSQIVMRTRKLTRKQAETMAQRFVSENKIFRDRLSDDSFGPEMIWIPAGQFSMGDIKNRGDTDEKPVHEVSIKRFAMSRYEVTFEESDRFAKATFAKATGRKKPDDRGRGRGKRPVINVSWDDAKAYVAWLSKETNKPYRLPSEAEWEYAARAGTSTKYWWGNQIGVNCRDCGSQWDGKKTAPVGSFIPNPFGIHDTAGNVWEWVADSYHKSYQDAPEDGSVWEGEKNLRVRRGGSFNYDNSLSRAAFRDRNTSDYRSGSIGFRVAVGVVAWTP